jgi:hypothetical protein
MIGNASISLMTRHDYCQKKFNQVSSGSLFLFFQILNFRKSPFINPNLILEVFQIILTKAMTILQTYLK